MSEVDKELVERLAQSRQLVGELDEVLVDKNNKVIDGAHRLKAYPGWKTRVINVNHKQALILRLHRNFRRTVSKQETKQLLNELALQLKNEGTPDEQIASEIVKLSPYSEAYTLSLLPKKYKQPKAVKAGEKAAKATYKVLYREEKPKPAEPAEKKLPKKYACPICGALLTLVGELLVPYHDALKK